MSISREKKYKVLDAMENYWRDILWSISTDAADFVRLATDQGLTVKEARSLLIWYIRENFSEKD